MAINSVSLSDALLPWRNAGVFFLLGEEVQEESLAHPIGNKRTNGKGNGINTFPRSPIGSDAPAAYGHTPPANTPQVAKAIASLSSGNDKNNSAKVENISVNTSTNHSLQSIEHLEIPTDDHFADSSIWPAEWQALLKRTPPAPVIWTYAELGADLLGQPKLPNSPERSACLKEFIASLKLKKGSSAFWPFSFPETDEMTELPTEKLSVHTEIFMAGLSLLKAKVLVVFDPASLKDAGYAKLPALPYQQHVLEGRLIVVLPSFNSIIADEAKKNAVGAFLQSALSRIYLP